MDIQPVGVMESMVVHHLCGTWAEQAARGWGQSCCTRVVCGAVVHRIHTARCSVWAGLVAGHLAGQVGEEEGLEFLAEVFVR